MKILQDTNHHHYMPGCVVGIILSAWMTITLAAPGTLSTQPLFTTNAIKPNIALILDDSGSMDWEHLFETQNGVLWWHTTNQSFVGLDKDDNVSAGTINYNPSGNKNSTWKRYVYLFPNGSGSSTSARRLYDDGNHGSYAVPPTTRLAWTRSSDFNSAYFNPATTYSPWTDNGDYTFVNIVATGSENIVDSTGTPVTTPVSVSGAPSDPIYNPATEQFDLEASIQSNATDWTFKMHNGMVIPAGTEFHCTGGTPTECDGTWTTEAGDINITTTLNVGITYYPATFCLTAGGALPAGYGFTAANIISGYDKDGNAAGMDCYEIKAANFTDNDDYKAAIQNFGNWFTYYRKRHLAMRAGMSASFDGLTGTYVDVVSINDTSVNMSMKDLDTAAERTTFFNTLFLATGSGITPTRRILDLVGADYDSTSTPVVTSSCQKNYSIIFTDGFASSTAPGTLPGGYDNAYLDPYDDTFTNTLADIAAKYYDRVRSDLADGDVAISDSCTGINLTTTATELDCNTDSHMNTYAVTLGIKGNIFGVTHTTVADAYTPVTPGTPGWSAEPDPSLSANAGTRAQVDDLYHATINGHGEMFNAANPTDIASSVESALTAITDEIGAASAVALNTTELDVGTVLFQARFDSKYWSGELWAKDIASVAVPADNVNIGDVESDADANWNAATVLPAAASRVIISFDPTDTHTDGTGLGVAFSAVANLSAADQLDLTTAANLPSGTPCGGAACTGTDLLNYLRGDRTHESATAFRVRDPDTVLGDIVHSSPIYVGEPNLGWPDGDGSNGFPSDDGNDATPFNGSYSEFISGHDRDGKEMIYFGANDGMLHGVQASDGVEKLAYIPRSLFSASASSGLHYLSEQGYTHRYYVDNEPDIADAFIKGRAADGTIDTTVQWRSVLLGSLRGGGKGLFALDVTDPANFSETNAKQLVLWEFSSDDDLQLGYTFSKPTIVPTNIIVGGNVRWAAIFGNGYNNGGDCHAELFIVFLDGGMDGTWTLDDANYETTDYLRFDTEIGGVGDCNGLSTPTIVDLNNDGKADRVYAGDVQGNMWAFDICNDADTSDGTILTCRESDWGITYYDSNPGAAETVVSRSDTIDADKATLLTYDPLPLFRATDSGSNAQPITVKPVVIRNPDITTASANNPNTLILFGTGQYLTSGDTTSATPQNTFYGVWDDNDIVNPVDIPYTRSDLVAQVISNFDILKADGTLPTGAETTDGVDDTRVLTDNAVNYAGSGGSKDAGWYQDLPDFGDVGNSLGRERVIVKALVRGDQVFFNTAVPTTDGCDVGGYTWQMNANANNGGRPSSAIFDVDGDGDIDADDVVTSGGSNYFASGRRFEGMSSSSTFSGDYKCQQSSKGDASCYETEVTGIDNVGRYSWEELKDD